MDQKAKQDIKHFIRIAIDPRNFIKGVFHVIRNFPQTIRTLLGFAVFFILLAIFLVQKVYIFFEHIPFIGRLFKFFRTRFGGLVGKPTKLLIQRLEKVRDFQVKQSYLIQIAFQSLRARTSRTVITIFGMATGVAIIVYLLSLGYGLEQLVISQVASLDELQIIDVSASQNTALKINEETLTKVSAIEEVSTINTLISLVGRVTYKQAQSDVLVYAADENYLAMTKPTLLKGKLFTDNGIINPIANISKNLDLKEDTGEVAGASIIAGSYMESRDSEIREVNIMPETAARVWETCDIKSKLIGYTTRFETSLYGFRMWGGVYSPFDEGGRVGFDRVNDKYLGEWVLMKVPVFTQNIDDKLQPILDTNGHQRWETGCVEQRFVQIIDSQSIEKQYRKKLTGVGEVLGIASDSADTASQEVHSETNASIKLLAALENNGVEATGEASSAFHESVIATDSAGIEYVTLEASESAQLNTQKKLSFDQKPSGKAVISTALMKLLGISENEVLGSRFDVSFIVTKALLPGIEGRAFSEDQSYEVIGLIDDENQPFFYIPINDMRNLGVTNFSQLKVHLKNKNDVSKIRLKIETYGYNTSSAADTVAEIESLFANIRIVLGSIGLVALAVASLGMFNTMTVSLLERTREIGGMKVIGMVSREIRDLFLAEAMIMGFSGGIGGLFLGYLLGQITSILVSIFSIANGLGYLNLTRIPLPFVISIVVLSFIVGIITGLYPAYRAKNISALNALRYE